MMGDHNVTVACFVCISPRRFRVSLDTAAASSDADVALGGLAGVVGLLGLLEGGGSLAEGDDSDGKGCGEDEEAWASTGLMGREWR